MRAFVSVCFALASALGTARVQAQNALEAGSSSEPAIAVPPTPAAASSSSAAQPAAPAVAAAPTPPPAVVRAPPFDPDSFGKKLTTWDASLEAGYGHEFGRSGGLWLGRAGAGLLFVRDPTFYSLGLSYEYSSLSVASLGVDAQLMRLDSGLWALVAVSSDLDHGFRPGASLSLGWSLFAVEGDVRSRDTGAITAVFAKLRIPLGVIGYALSRH